MGVATVSGRPQQWPPHAALRSSIIGKRTLSHGRDCCGALNVAKQLTDKLHRQLNQEKHMNPLITPTPGSPIPGNPVPGNPMPDTPMPDAPLPDAEPEDEDLAEQANPGHGVPSQDPDPAAQTQLEPEDVEREANSVYIGGGGLAGAATGAAIGVAVAGPVGVMVGAAIGAVAGAAGGAAAGAATKPKD